MAGEGMVPRLRPMLTIAPRSRILSSTCHLSFRKAESRFSWGLAVDTCLVLFILTHLSLYIAMCVRVYMINEHEFMNFRDLKHSVTFHECVV